MITAQLERTRVSHDDAQYDPLDGGQHRRRRPPRKRRVDSECREEILPQPDPSLSRSMEYGAAILTACTRQAAPLEIARLAEVVGLGRSTTHRYVTTLMSLGWLEQDAKRRYKLASGAHDVGLAALGSIARQTGSRQVLEQLRDWTGFTASLAVLDGTQATYVERLAAHGKGQYAADLGLRAGAHVPLHCTAAGKALLASLSDPALDDLLPSLSLTAAGPLAIRSSHALKDEIERVEDDDGLAVSADELALGVCSIALAVRAVFDDRRLAVEVTVPRSSCRIEHLRPEVGPFLHAAVKSILIRSTT